MKYAWIILLAVLSACQPQGKKGKATGTSGSPLIGNWQFLDGYGNYNEAWFGDSTYQTINRFVDRKVLVKYTVRGDSLFSRMDLRGGARVIPAGLVWLGNDRVVISTGFVSDTLVRMANNAITLRNTDPFTDSVAFFEAFNRRYEDFLVRKGIVTREEIDAYRERQEVPRDVLQKIQDP